jgi:hypothetical protein
MTPNEPNGEQVDEGTAGAGDDELEQKRVEQEGDRAEPDDHERHPVGEGEPDTP